MTTDDIDPKIKKMLSIEEGRKKFIYTDTVGKVTIGVGRNLSDKGISDAVIDLMLSEDILEASLAAVKIFPEIEDYEEARQAAIINMIFNLGAAGFEKFISTISCIRAKQWDLASQKCLKSKWAFQVPARAARVSYMFRTGKFPEDYKIDEI